MKTLSNSDLIDILGSVPESWRELDLRELRKRECFTQTTEMKRDFSEYFDYVYSHVERLIGDGPIHKDIRNHKHIWFEFVKTFIEYDKIEKQNETRRDCDKVRTGKVSLRRLTYDTLSRLALIQGLPTYSIVYPGSEGN